MTTPRRKPRKPYSRPTLIRYGDLRTLTGGGKKKGSERSLTGHKTRIGTG